ncbi:MAG TPA: flavodoxin [Candidatus Ruminococcus avistercoris]|nr:flavodoxin [Candidatus Ruminococcus avistercoris]
MNEIVVVYWSGSGNTQMMAQAIGQGIEEEGKKAKVVYVDDITPDELKKASLFAMGCPAMGDEVLEEGSMEPFVEAVEGFAGGKTVALFGSYDWGDGAWMRDWENRMRDAGAFLLNDAGLIVNNEPDEEGLAACRQLGRQMAQR